MMRTHVYTTAAQIKHLLPLLDILVIKSKMDVLIQLAITLQLQEQMGI
jgi:hypothetical protein